ncbi:hypothetical protein OEZ85_008250 [Tetradesmus obliquus]|uniref:phytol kinase n=1 Tax=Tetradesmus obliquus TaxID=3088 RepID=A0ABY8TKC1_TETOB|nr:hypothetical protein OEZ85_008250 [Tetradesmus obliquus]
MASQRYYQKDGKTIVQTGSQTSSSSSSKASSSKAAQSSSLQSSQQRKREFPALHKRLFAALSCANAGEACQKMRPAQKQPRKLVPAVQHSLQAGSNRREGRRGRAEQESATRYGLGRLLTVVALMADDVLLVPVSPAMQENFGLEVATTVNTTRAAAKAVFSKLREADPAADAAPWVALVARCMQLSGAALAATVLTPDSAELQENNQRPPVMQDLSHFLQTELDDVEWPRPGCSNLEQLSESALVGGKVNICSGCKLARYCGKDCQVQHWKQHKTACKRMQAARTR